MTHNHGQQNSSGVRSRYRIFILILVSLPITGCFPTAELEVEVTAAEYNGKPVFDRTGSIQGPGDNEPGTPKLGDPRFGPYFDGVRNSRDASEESVALLAPMLDGSQEALLKSDCYWVAEDTEAFSVNWEAVMTLQREPLHLTCNSAVTVGLCRLTNPEYGNTLEFVAYEAPDTSACPPTDPTDMTIKFPILAFAIADGDEPTRLEFPEDLAFYQATFSGRKLPATSDDPYGRCPDISLFTGPATATGLHGNVCQNENGLSPVCAARCMLNGPESAAYSVSIPGISPDLELLPAISLVPASGRKIARPLAPDAATGLYTWNTNADGPECYQVGQQKPAAKQYYRCRWHENFSPSVQVESVRVFVVMSNRTEQTLLPSGPLRIRSYNPQSDDAELWTCNFDAGGSVVNLRSGCDGESFPAVTPTYWLDAYRNALALDKTIGAVPLISPLQWGVNLNSSTIPDGGIPYIEFTLDVVKGQSLMSVDPVKDLGNKRIGRSASGSILLTNIGSAIARVDSLRFIGEDQDDFRYRVLSNRRSGLVIPVEISERPGNRFRVEVAESMENYLSLLESGIGAIDNRLALRSPSAVAWATAIRDGRVDPPVAVNRASPVGVSPVIPTVNPRHLDNPLVRRAGDALRLTRSLPFTVSPGESVEIFVDLTPSETGERWTMLRIDGVDATRPDRDWWVASTIVGVGLYGPDLMMFPDTTREFPNVRSRNSLEHTVYLVNTGDMPARRTNITITGPDASRFHLLSQHAAEREILSGSDEMFQLKMRNRCAYTTHSGALLW
ncbi:MAG: hypothetical protein O7G86_14145, partial [Gammaproteobacteria bacterium]|nr:hypothetical protein [Gammaproteobacteria bacterium]